MARGWPFFSATLRLIEMALAEAEPAIAEPTIVQLVPAPLRPLGEDLRDRLDLARRTVLDALDATRCSPTIRCCGGPSMFAIRTWIRSTSSRSACSSGCAATRSVSPELWQAFLVTVNGIAAGMRNVG